MRAFIALPIPASDAEVLEAMADRLDVGRAVPSENAHLTLAFLGDAEEALLREVADALETLSPPEFTFDLAGIRSFGRALALQAHGGAALIDLQARVRSRLHGAGLALERRRFRPHVTFARLPERLTLEDEARLAAFLARENTMALRGIPAREVVLYESILTRDGAVYVPLAEFALS
ncbi:RNA 2',3'-cyclic phosphodiesterase [Roseivivax sp. CAU 1753]